MLSKSSKKAEQEQYRSTEVISQVHGTVAEWNTANEQLTEVVIKKYHDAIYNSASKRLTRQFNFGSSTSARFSIDRLFGATSNKQLMLKRLNSSPTKKINKTKRQRTTESKENENGGEAQAMPYHTTEVVQNLACLIEREETRNFHLSSAHKVSEQKLCTKPFAQRSKICAMLQSPQKMTSPQRDQQRRTKQTQPFRLPKFLISNNSDIENIMK